MASEFSLVGEIRAVEAIATGRSIRILDRLNRLYGKGNWHKLKGIATVRLPDGTLAEAGDSLVRSARNWQAQDQDQAPPLIAMPDQKRFVVCIRNEEHEDSLELRKIYEVLVDAEAAKHQMLRIVDEEGEDYLYPASWFLSIDLPQNLEQAIRELTHR